MASLFTTQMTRSRTLSGSRVVLGGGRHGDEGCGGLPGRSRWAPRPAPGLAAADERDPGRDGAAGEGDAGERSRASRVLARPLNGRAPPGDRRGRPHVRPGPLRDPSFHRELLQHFHLSAAPRDHRQQPLRGDRGRGREGQERPLPLRLHPLHADRARGDAQPYHIQERLHRCRRRPEPIGQLGPHFCDFVRGLPSSARRL